MFLGVPHRGSPYTSWASILSGLARSSGFDMNSRNMNALRFDSGELELLREEFVRLWREGPCKVKTFQEALGMVGINGLNGKVCAPSFGLVVKSSNYNRLFLTSHPPSTTLARRRSISLPTTGTCAASPAEMAQATHK